MLSAPDADRARDRIRAEVGTPAGCSAVRHAPTWRDDELADEEGPSYRLHLDLARAAERLGPGHALLVRLHHQVTDALDGIDVPRFRACPTTPTSGTCSWPRTCW